MFDFNTASLQITKEEILKYITELQILKRYCSNYKNFNNSFKSEFYNDTNASCKLVISANGIPYYKDYGNGDYFLAFDYVSRKYRSNYHETCNIISNDFGIKRGNVKIVPELLLNEDTPKLIKIKSIIKPYIKSFNIIDLNYWSQYGISLNTLNHFNVKACSHVSLIKGYNHFLFEYTKSNPLYSYRFFKNNNEQFKIYNPFGTKETKWLSNVGADCLQGYDQLPELGNLLILTKSLKDVMSLYELGYNAIGLQAETNKLSDKSYKELSNRFKEIIILFDNDEQGRISTGEFFMKYELKFFFIDDTKDISDYIKMYNIKKAKIILKNKIKCLDL